MAASQPCIKKAKFDHPAPIGPHKNITADFNAESIKAMRELRDKMNEQILLWALFSFNNVENGAYGGVYEILERNEVIYISALPPGYHVRDALNSHFSGDDELQLGHYLTSQGGSGWRNYYVRYMVSEKPWDDAQMLLRHFQLENHMKFPRFNVN